MTDPIIYAIEEEHLKMDGLTTEVMPWEDGRRISTDRGTFEWWYFDAHLDDGSTAVIVFATKPITNPRVSLLPNLSITITRPDGRKTAEFVLPGAEAFSAAQDACHVRIGDATVDWALEDGHWTYHLRTASATQGAELTFRGIVPPWRPGAGKAYFGNLERFFAWLPAIPHGIVEGTLTYDGQTHAVRGSGYHDHNWGNVPLPAILHHWTWGRAHLGDYTLIFVEQVATPRYGSLRLPVFLLARGGQVLADDARCLRMQEREPIQHPGGHSYPRQVDFIYELGQEQVLLKLHQPRLIEAASLLGALPRWQRPLARLFANPWYFRFDAELDLTIAIQEVHDHLQGRALYELMLLR